MDNQNPLEMQNPDLNPNHPPHLSARPTCAFCGATLVYSAKQCAACGAQAEHAPTPVEHDTAAKPDAEPPKNPLERARTEAIKSRLEPDHSKPVDKQKLIYSIIIIVLALIVIGLLQNQSF